VLVQCCSLAVIGYRVATFNDCAAAAEELKHVGSFICTSAKEVMFSLPFVCLFVWRITQKQLNQFSQSSVEWQRMGRGRND